ncbi:MAG: hypothetical protein VYD86_02275 [Verrucomicrobiota bacterium]|nr:hypothetical protein [Verrucomicrobiota bacterium]
MVRSRHDNRIDVFPLTKSAIVGVGVARFRAVLFSDGLRSRLAAQRATLLAATVVQLVRITNSDNLHGGFVKKRLHHAHAPGTTTNQADRDSLTGCRFARLAKRR